MDLSGGPGHIDQWARGEAIGGFCNRHNLERFLEMLLILLPLPSP